MKKARMPESKERKPSAKRLRQEWPENSRSKPPKSGRNGISENHQDRISGSGRNRTGEDASRKGLKTTSKTSTDRKAKTSVGSNREFAVVTYIFLIIFLILIAYFVYFMLAKSDSFINSSYNPRLDSMSKTVVRGEILCPCRRVFFQRKIRNRIRGKLCSAALPHLFPGADRE